MVQIDHLCGEIIGNTIDRLYEAGASNVQVLSSITKKNRPSYVIFIDCRPKFVDEIEKVIISDLGTGGWHIFNTTHRHLVAEKIKRNITFNLGDIKFDYIVEFKHIGDGDGNIRVEFESCKDLVSYIFSTYEQRVPVRRIYNILSGVNFNSEKTTEIFIGEKED